MIFDGFDFGPFLRCNPVRRIVAPVDVSSRSVPGVDGEFVGAVRLRPMDIEVRARVVADVQGHVGFSELRRVLAGRLYRTEPSWLVLDDDPSIRYLALMTDATDPSGWWQGATVDLTFTCHDPVGYGAHHVLALGEGTSVVDVGGTYEAAPVFDVDAAAGSEVRVADAESGMHVQVPASESARRVSIDCSRRLATSGGEHAAVTLRSRFFRLAPGRHEVSVSGGPCTVSFDERWV